MCRHFYSTQLLQVFVRSVELWADRLLCDSMQWALLYLPASAVAMLCVVVHKTFATTSATVNHFVAL